MPLKPLEKEPEQEALVTVHTLAKLTEIPASFWYTRAERGDVPSFKVGRYRRFRVSSVVRWLEERAEGRRSA